MDTNRILHIAADAGRIILENGGETYRVEETVCRICNSLGVKESDSFVTPTGMMISVTDETGHVASLVRRIPTRTVNLRKIAEVNDLSRNITKQSITIDSVEHALKEIDNIPHYDKITLIFFASIATSFFTLLYGGNINDSVVSFFIGAIIKLISLKLAELKVNDFFTNILGGAVVTFIAMLCIYLNLAQHSDKIIIGSIMLLVPGLAITNAIRDTIEGDLVSGVARTVEALFIAVAIAVGSGIILKIWFV